MLTQAQREQIVSILDAADDLTIATVREDGYPQATTVSFASDGLSIYFGTWSKSQKALAKLNAMLVRSYTFKTLPEKPIDPWTSEKAIEIHGQWWEARIARQQEIDASIAAKAEFEFLYDKPYADNSRIRVAGPFTVESLSPHRTLAVDWNDELIDILKASEGKREAPDRDDVADRREERNAGADG